MNVSDQGQTSECSCRQDQDPWRNHLWRRLRGQNFSARGCAVLRWGYAAVQHLRRHGRGAV